MHVPPSPSRMPCLGHPHFFLSNPRLAYQRLLLSLNTLARGGSDQERVLQRFNVGEQWLCLRCLPPLFGKEFHS